MKVIPLDKVNNNIANPALKEDLVDFKEKAFAPLPEPKKKHSNFFYAASILSLGLVPLVHYGLNKIIPTVVMPSILTNIYGLMIKSLSTKRNKR